MYQKPCSWMDYFCALVLISEAKVVYMYIFFWHCLYIVFIAIYVFINFDHVYIVLFLCSIIYIYVTIYICICSCPSPSSILFQRDPKTPSRGSSNLRCKIPVSVLTLQMPFRIQQIPELLMQETMYAMHTVFAPCHGTTLHPATKGVKWEGIYTYIIQTNQICFKKTTYKTSKQGKT